MSERDVLLKKVQQKLKISFNNKTLLDEALTRRSIVRVKKKGVFHN